MTLAQLDALGRGSQPAKTESGQRGTVADLQRFKAMTRQTAG